MGERSGRPVISHYRNKDAEIEQLRAEVERLRRQLREAEAAVSQYEEVMQALDVLNDLPTGGVVWPTNPSTGSVAEGSDG